MKQDRDFVAEPGEHRQDDSEALFEMANLFPKHTGLPFVVWISYKGGAQHDGPVKVSPGPKALASRIASIAIRLNVHVVGGKMDAADLALPTKWIELNRDVLVKHWHGDIDAKEAIDEIRPVK